MPVRAHIRIGDCRQDPECLQCLGDVQLKMWGIPTLAHTSPQTSEDSCSRQDLTELLSFPPTYTAVI